MSVEIGCRKRSTLICAHEKNNKTTKPFGSKETVTESCEEITPSPELCAQGSPGQHVRHPDYQVEEMPKTKAEIGKFNFSHLTADRARRLYRLFKSV